jgi:catechol 2,3-dioxygenase-like lactoylglutathione lyase family enzyme
MKRVTGIGGIFFKSKDPKGLGAWYREHLGVESMGDGMVFGQFPWRDAEDPSKEGETVWAIHKHDTKYFAPSEAPFMINYRVDDLDAVLAALRAEGCKVDDKIEDSEYGKFGWVMDPDGNRIELWQPPKK